MLTLHTVGLLGMGAAAISLLMAAVWLVQRRTGNAGVVDVAWAASVGLLAVAYALAGRGFEERRLLAGVMGGLWGLRLAWHIHRRSHGRPEDGRYQQLRKDWAPHVQARFFQFFQFQALAAAFFSIPFLLAAESVRGRLLPVELAAAGLWLAALIGETVADAQLEAFKRDPAGRGQVCRRGLWRFSRHPNYFFEWLIWCSFALFATPAPGGLVAWLCPALMLYFLFRVTGIPATEAQALRSRGEAYRAYQRTTSAFVPWFPRKA